MNILLVNLGNTSTTLARAGRAGAVTVLERCIGVYSSDARRAVSTYISRHGLKAAVLCSVVPAQTEFWISVLQKAFGCQPMVIGPHLDLGVTLDYQKPDTIGTDRLADICGAVRIHGAPVLAVDIGTAATFNMVRAGGVFVGGAIAPGPALFTRYLSDRTAQLPLVDFPSGHLPRIGRSTKEAISLAAGVGYSGMVDSIVSHILHGSRRRIPVVVTGGYARQVIDRSDSRYIVDPLLTLKGMGYAYAMNSSRG